MKPVEGVEPSHYQAMYPNRLNLYRQEKRGWHHDGVQPRIEGLQVSTHPTAGMYFMIGGQVHPSSPTITPL